MVRIKNILLIALLSFFLIQPAQGQRLLRNLSNKVMKKAEERFEKKTEEKVEEKVDENIDKKLDEVDKSETRTNSGKTDHGTSSTEQQLQGLMKGLGFSSTPVPIADSYQFDHLVQMHIESFDKNGNKISDGEFVTHFDPNSESMAYQAISGDMADSGQGLFIIDTKNKATIILTEENGEKKGMVYGMGGFFESMGEVYKEEDVDLLSETPETYLANPNVTKTGRTKTIAGYKCEEFVYEDEDGKSNVWITKDLKLNTKDFFSSLFKTTMASNGMGWGYMMEATSVNKESGEKSIMKVTKVDTNSNVRFSLSGYEITNLGSFQPPSEK